MTTFALENEIHERIPKFLFEQDRGLVSKMGFSMDHKST